ncbi:MAG: hypothetical protein HPY53_12390 [Brevinematales bacterium]|nr:hypothetical protein [Brevinematales bacterium]
MKINKIKESFFNMLKEMISYSNKNNISFEVLNNAVDLFFKDYSAHLEYVTLDNFYRFLIGYEKEKGTNLAKLLFPYIKKGDYASLLLDKDKDENINKKGIN